MCPVFCFANMRDAARFRRIGYEVFWISLGQFLAVAGGLVGVRLMTQVLTPDSYGELALGMTVAMLAQQTFTLPIGNAAIRFFASAREGASVNAYLRAVWRLIGLSVLLLLVLMGIMLGLLVGSGRGAWLGLAISACVFAVILSVSDVFGGMQNAARNRIVVAWHNGFAVWLRFGLGFLAVRILGAQSSFAMTGYALGAAAVLLSQYGFYRWLIKPIGQETDSCLCQKADYWRVRLLSYAWPFAIWGLFYWLQVASDRWALEFLATRRDIGEYAVLYQIGYYPMTILSGLMAQLVAPILFGRAGDASDASRVRDAVKLNRILVWITVGMTIIGALLAQLLHEWIFSWFVDARYAGASGLLALMVGAGGLFSAGQIANYSFLSGNKPRALLAPKIGTAIWGAGLNFLGAYLMGLRGVVYAVLLVSFTYLGWMLISEPRLTTRDHVRGT